MTLYDFFKLVKKSAIIVLSHKDIYGKGVYCQLDSFLKDFEKAGVNPNSLEVIEVFSGGDWEVCVVCKKITKK